MSNKTIAEKALGKEDILLSIIKGRNIPTVKNCYDAMESYAGQQVTTSLKDVEGLIDQRLKEIALLPAKYPMIDTSVLENELTDLLTQVQNLNK